MVWRRHGGRSLATEGGFVGLGRLLGLGYLLYRDLVGYHWGDINCPTRDSSCPGSSTLGGTSPKSSSRSDARHANRTGDRPACRVDYAVDNQNAKRFAGSPA